MLNSEYLKNLNENQREATLCIEGPLLIVAGAGSGKTRVVKERIKDIILEQDVSANNILCLSFSKAAQQTMLERFREDNDLKKYGKQIGDNSVRTIHSLGREISGSKQNINENDSEMKEFQSELDPSDYPLISSQHPENTEGYPNFRKSCIQLEYSRTIFSFVRW